MTQRILVVDDSGAVRARLRDCLPGPEFEVVEAEDGLEALELLRSDGAIRLVFLDVNMPRLDGISMLERLQSEGVAREVPIIVLTTEGQAALVERAKRAGAKGWLIKPFEPETILKTARAALLRAARNGKGG